MSRGSHESVFKSLHKDVCSCRPDDMVGYPQRKYYTAKEIPGMDSQTLHIQASSSIVLLNSTLIQWSEDRIESRLGDYYQAESQ